MNSFDLIALTGILIFFASLAGAGYSHYRYRERNNSVYRKTFGNKYNGNP